MGQSSISHPFKATSSLINKMLAVTCLALVVLSPAVLGSYATHQPSQQCHTEYETVTSYEQQCTHSAYGAKSCHQVPKQNCHQVPKQNCHQVPRQNCHQVPRENCHQVPQQNCK